MNPRQKRQKYKVCWCSNFFSSFFFSPSLSVPMRWLNWRVSQTGPSAWVWPTSQRLSSETWTRFILFPQWSRWCKFFHSFIFHCLICLCRLWCNPNSHQVRVRYDLVNFLNVLQGPHEKQKQTPTFDTYMIWEWKCNIFLDNGFN